MASNLEAMAIATIQPFRNSRVLRQWGAESFPGPSRALAPRPFAVRGGPLRALGHPRPTARDTQLDLVPNTRSILAPFVASSCY